MSGELKTVLISLGTSLIVSLVTFILGLRSGKNQADRQKLQEMYKALYAHFADLKKSIQEGQYKTWENYERVEKGVYTYYYPPVRKLEESGDLIFLKKVIAEKAKDLEVRAMELGSEKWIPAIHRVLVDNAQLFKGGYELERPYYGNKEPLNHLKTKNPTGCQGFKMLSYKAFYDENRLKTLLKKLDEQKEYSLAFSSRGNSPAYTFQLYPDSLAVPVDEFIGTLTSEFTGKIEGYNQFNKEKNQLLKEIAVLEKKLYKRAREPYSFWETFFGAFADLFR